MSRGNLVQDMPPCRLVDSGRRSSITSSAIHWPIYNQWSRTAVKLRLLEWLIRKGTPECCLTILDFTQLYRYTAFSGQSLKPNLHGLTQSHGQNQTSFSCERQRSCRIDQIQPNYFLLPLRQLFCTPFLFYGASCPPFARHSKRTWSRTASEPRLRSWPGMTSTGRLGVPSTLLLRWWIKASW